MLKFTKIVWCLSVVLQSILVTPVLAAEWPEKPIRIVVPFPPGGATDAAARVYATRMSRTLGQPILIENKAGAGGEIGGEFVAKAAPDGYTLLMGALGSLAIQESMGEKRNFNLKSFTGVSLATTMPMALAVSDKLGVNSVGELIVRAKEDPGKLTIGSGGTGTSQHMAGELFQSVTGTRLNHIPYRGSGPAIADLLGGQIDLVIDTSAALMGQASNRKIRILAVTTAERSPYLPNVPTMSEQGVQGYIVTTSYALLAPAGTPTAILKRLSEAMREAASSDDVKAAVASQGAIARTSTPEETNIIIQEEVKKWSQVVKSLR